MSGSMNGPEPGLREPVAENGCPQPDPSRDGFENEKSDVSFSERRTGPSPEGDAMTKRVAAGGRQSTIPQTMKAAAIGEFRPPTVLTPHRLPVRKPGPPSTSTSWRRGPRGRRD